MQLAIGVLIVGSLDWESKDYGGVCKEELGRHKRGQAPHREAWRKGRLMDDAESEFRVKVPIR